MLVERKLTLLFFDPSLGDRKHTTCWTKKNHISTQIMRDPETHIFFKSSLLIKKVCFWTSSFLLCIVQSLWFFKMLSCFIVINYWSLHDSTWEHFYFYFIVWHTYNQCNSGLIPLFFLFKVAAKRIFQVVMVNTLRKRLVGEKRYWYIYI